MRLFKVSSLSKVDTTKYREGDFFITDKSVSILVNGKIETLVKQSDIRKIVRDEIKKVQAK